MARRRTFVMVQTAQLLLAHFEDLLSIVALGKVGTMLARAGAADR
jgi:hypothetical protein